MVRFRRPLRVASVPSSHVYVRHLSPATGTEDVVRLPDPDPDDPRRPAAGAWWPPAVLDPGWPDRADGVDLVHLHFGFDAQDPADLERWVAALRSRRIPLVFTVHDLRNPHHRDRTLHDAQLDVLVPAAARLLTLTTGAAREIARRWGREAVVVPHPHVVPLDVMAAAADRPARDGVVVGMHVKSLRACMDPLALLPALREAVASIPGGRLQVNGHRDVLEPGGARYDAALHRALSVPDVDLRVHDFLPDDRLWDYLAGLDVSVLPYRFGTHSGWLEACRDLGTAVVAPVCGHYSDQGPVHPFVLEEDRYEPGSLIAAVRSAAAEPARPAGVAVRTAQRDRVAAAHAAVYAQALASVGREAA